MLAARLDDGMTLFRTQTFIQQAGKSTSRWRGQYAVCIRSVSPLRSHSQINWKDVSVYMVMFFKIAFVVEFDMRCEVNHNS